MSTLLIVLIATRYPLEGSRAFESVRVGDSAADVGKRLGPPTAIIGDEVVWSKPNECMFVTFGVDGKVVSCYIVPRIGTRPSFKDRKGTSSVVPLGTPW